jgi:hypothetical protein
MNKEELWITMSYAWTEIGLEKDEYITHAQRISASLKDIWLVRKIVFLQVVPAFAFNSFIAIRVAQKLGGRREKPIVFIGEGHDVYVYEAKRSA